MVSATSRADRLPLASQGENLEEKLPDIFATWDQLDRPPKVHFSSPRSKKRPKSHADFIDPEQFSDFIEIAQDYKFDIMVEAKKKDAAVLKLWEDIGFDPPRNY
jgi:UV DNA damage endonuclease